MSFVVRLDSVTWDDKVVEGLNFMADHVLQVPLFLMTLMRYMTPTLDNLYVSHRMPSIILDETLWVTTDMC